MQIMNWAVAVRFCRPMPPSKVLRYNTGRTIWSQNRCQVALQGDSGWPSNTTAIRAMSPRMENGSCSEKNKALGSALAMTYFTDGWSLSWTLNHAAKPETGHDAQLGSCRRLCHGTWWYTLLLWGCQFTQWHLVSCCLEWMLLVFLLVGANKIPKVLLGENTSAIHDWTPENLRPEWGQACSFHNSSSDHLIIWSLDKQSFTVRSSESLSEQLTCQIIIWLFGFGCDVCDKSVDCGVAIQFILQARAVK